MTKITSKSYEHISVVYALYNDISFTLINKNVKISLKMIYTFYNDQNKLENCMNKLDL